METDHPEVVVVQRTAMADAAAAVAGEATVTARHRLVVVPVGSRVTELAAAVSVSVALVHTATDEQVDADMCIPLEVDVVLPPLLLLLPTMSLVESTLHSRTCSRCFLGIPLAAAGIRTAPHVQLAPPWSPARRVAILQ